MAFYVVKENVKLTSDDRQLKKDKVFEESEVSPENLKRWLQKVYVRKLDETPEESDESDESKPSGETKPSGDLPYFLTVDYYLTPDEVNKLKQVDLIRYGQHIEVPNFNLRATVTNMKKQINEFIATIEDDDDEDLEGNGEGGSQSGVEGSNGKNENKEGGTNVGG